MTTLPSPARAFRPATSSLMLAFALAACGPDKESDANKDSEYGEVDSRSAAVLADVPRAKVPGDFVPATSDLLSELDHFPGLKRIEEVDTSSDEPAGPEDRTVTSFDLNAKGLPKSAKRKRGGGEAEDLFRVTWRDSDGRPSKVEHYSYLDAPAAPDEASARTKRIDTRTYEWKDDPNVPLFSAFPVRQKDVDADGSESDTTVACSSATRCKVMDKSTKEGKTTAITYDFEYLAPRLIGIANARLEIKDEDYEFVRTNDYKDGRWVGTGLIFKGSEEATSTDEAGNETKEKVPVESTTTCVFGTGGTKTCDSVEKTDGRVSRKSKAKMQMVLIEQGGFGKLEDLDLSVESTGYDKDGKVSSGPSKTVSTYDSAWRLTKRVETKPHDNTGSDTGAATKTTRKTETAYTYVGETRSYKSITEKVDGKVSGTRTYVY